MLVPDDLDAQTPIVDVPDLAEFVVDGIERELSGVVNMTSTAPVTLHELFAACAAAP